MSSICFVSLSVDGTWRFFQLFNVIVVGTQQSPVSLRILCGLLLKLLPSTIKFFSALKSKVHVLRSVVLHSVTNNLQGKRLLLLLLYG